MDCGLKIETLSHMHKHTYCVCMRTRTRTSSILNLIVWIMPQAWHRILQQADCFAGPGRDHAHAIYNSPPNRLVSRDLRNERNCGQIFERTWEADSGQKESALCESPDGLDGWRENQMDRWTDNASRRLAQWWTNYPDHRDGDGRRERQKWTE